MKTRPLGESPAMILSLSRHLLGPPRPHFVTREGGQALGPLPGLAAVTRAHHASLGPPTQPGWQGRRPARPQATGAPPRRLRALSARTEACVSTGLRSAAGDVVATCPGHVARGPAHNRPGFLRPGTLRPVAHPAGAHAPLTRATLPASSSSVSLRRALKLLTMSRTPLPVSPCGNQNRHPVAGPWAPGQGAGPEGRRHLGGPGLAVHAVHGLGAGVDGVGELLLHVPVGLRDLPDAGEGQTGRP